MNICFWQKNSFVVRRKTLRLYKRGMTLAKKEDHVGAITNYTNAIDFPDVPADVKAMALYNRALVHVAVGDDAKGVDDLDAVLAMDEAIMVVNIRTMATQKLAKIESRKRNREV